MSNWLCLQVQTKRETQVAESLSSLGVSSYAPERVVIIREARRQPYPRRQPLFPSYLFASMDYFDNLAGIRRLPIKLRSYVIGEIDYSFIEEMREREQQGLIHLSQQSCPFVPGDLVEINTGSLLGTRGIFDAQLSDRERCVILITLFNQPIRVKQAIADLSLVFEAA